MTKDERAALLSNGLPQPPIPHRLRELLKDYPDHLERLQEALNYAFDGPKPVRGGASHVFEQVIWALEGRLETFFREANAELRVAEADGEGDAIARARQKKSAMGFASSINDGMANLDEVWNYIQEHNEVLR